MYWTNEDLLSLIGQSLVTTESFTVDKKSLLPLGPSSTILLEFSTDTDGTTTIVKAFVDDQEVKLKQCKGASPCKASDFQAELSKGIQIDKGV